MRPRVFAVCVTVFAALVAVLAVGVGVLAADVPASAEPAPVVQVAEPVQAQETTQPGGPQLDPETNADAEKTQSKIIVGVIAAVLAVIVIFGRRAKNKKAKKSGK